MERGDSDYLRRDCAFILSTWSVHRSKKPLKNKGFLDATKSVEKPL
jgi:hypothetical protein